MMKKTITICIAFLLIILTSCEKDSVESKVIRTLTIDNVSHTFIDENGNHYVENTLISQQDIQKYKLKMIKGVEYRISASQPNALINQTKMTLIKSAGDTLAFSGSETVSKSVIVITSPETADYYLIVGLNTRTNPQFVYHLYFEEIVDDGITYSGFDWKSNGSWNTTELNTIELKNYDSRVYRHIKLNSPVSGSPALSFVIQSSTATIPIFGFVLDPSPDLIQFSEYAYELPSTGYAFLAFKNIDEYTIINLNPGSMSLNWGNLTNINMNTETGIKVELKYESNMYRIYINGVLLNAIHGSLQDIDILIQENGFGVTKIKDFSLVY